MKEDEKYINKDAMNLQVVRLVIWGLVWVALIFFTTVSGCVMYGDSVEADQTRAETEQIIEQAKIAKMKVDAIKDLIAKGTNPLTARCAIMGYTVMVQYGQVINPCLRFLESDNKGEQLK